MNAYNNIDELNKHLIKCRLCPRLVAWREQVAKEKKPSFAKWDYWGKPVPGFGDPNAEMLIVGLAPAAHGGNRTGRIFTGDRSGDWLFRALYEAGFSNQAESCSKYDNLQLKNTYVTATVKCAPPQNKPTLQECINCNPWLQNEMSLLTHLKVIVALGQLAFQKLLQMTKTKTNWIKPKTPAKFKHGLEVPLSDSFPILIASYHPSQQNTFTGKLKKDDFATIFQRARELLK